MGAEISVLVVDDHELLAESVARVLDLQEDLTVVGIATDLRQALRLMRAGRPDVVLLDAALGPEDGIAAIPSLLTAHDGAKIVVLTGLPSDHVLLAAVEAGVAGFLTKSGGLPDVLAAVRQAAAGESVISSALLGRLLPLMTRRSTGSDDELSAREREVVRLVAEGLSNAQIAERLSLSTHTVRNHVSSLSRKLGAHSKLEVLSIALREGLIEPR